MSVTVQCPGCFRVYRIKSELVGKSVQCKDPECGETINVLDAPPPAPRRPKRANPRPNAASAPATESSSKAVLIGGAVLGGTLLVAIAVMLLVNRNRSHQTAQPTNEAVAMRADDNSSKQSSKDLEEKAAEIVAAEADSKTEVENRGIEEIREVPDQVVPVEPAQPNDPAPRELPPQQSIEPPPPGEIEVLESYTAAELESKARMGKEQSTAGFDNGGSAQFNTSYVYADPADPAGLAVSYFSGRSINRTVDTKAVRESFSESTSSLIKFSQSFPLYFGQFRNGKRTGQWLVAHENGNRRTVGQYIGGVRHGLFGCWDQEGALAWLGQYQHGQLISGTGNRDDNSRVFGADRAFCAPVGEEFVEIRFSPDGRLIAAISVEIPRDERIISGPLVLDSSPFASVFDSYFERFSTNGRVTVWDVATGRELFSGVDRFSGDDRATRIRFSADGTIVAVQGLHGLTLYQTETGAPSDKIPVQNMSFAMSADGSTLYWAGTNGVVRKTDVRSRKSVPTQIVAEDVLALSSDGRILISRGAPKGSVAVCYAWNAQTEKILGVFAKASKNNGTENPSVLQFLTCAFARSRNVVLVPSDDSLLYWDFDAGQQEQRLLRIDGVIDENFVRDRFCEVKASDDDAQFIVDAAESKEDGNPHFPTEASTAELQHVTKHHRAVAAVGPHGMLFLWNVARPSIEEKARVEPSEGDHRENQALSDDRPHTTYAEAMFLVTSDVPPSKWIEEITALAKQQASEARQSKSSPKKPQSTAQVNQATADAMAACEFFYNFVNGIQKGDVASLATQIDPGAEGDLLSIRQKESTAQALVRLKTLLRRVRIRSIGLTADKYVALVGENARGQQVAFAMSHTGKGTIRVVHIRVIGP